MSNEMSNKNSNMNSTRENMVSESGSLKLMQSHGKVITNSFFFLPFFVHFFYRMLDQHKLSLPHGPGLF